MPDKLSDECLEKLREIEKSLLIAQTTITSFPDTMDEGAVLIAQIVSDKVEQTRNHVDENCKEVLRGIESDIGNQVYLYRAPGSGRFNKGHMVVALNKCLNHVRSAIEKHESM